MPVQKPKKVLSSRKGAGAPSDNDHGTAGAKGDVTGRTAIQNRQRGHKRANEQERRSPGDGHREHPKRQKKSNPSTAASRTSGKSDPREAVLNASDEFRALMANCQDEVERSSSEIYETLSSFSTGAAEADAPQPRPAASMYGKQCLAQFHELVKIYEEHNTHMMERTAEMTPGRWATDIKFISKSLDSGASYGIDLVGAMLKPCKEPKLPVLDEAQAQETDKAGVELFQAQDISRDTWGRTARILVDGWTEFLMTPSKC